MKKISLFVASFLFLATVNSCNSNTNLNSELLLDKNISTSSNKNQSRVKLKVDHPSVERSLKRMNWSDSGDKFVTILKGELSYSTDNWQTEKTTKTYVPGSSNGYFLVDLPPNTNIKYKAKVNLCFTDTDMYFHLACNKTTPINVDNNGESFITKTK